jgi:hypothetical protein
MIYTFWHAGISIGEGDLEPSPERPRRHAGIFRPTGYGLELFPRLTGILSAGHALKTSLEEQGRSADDLEKKEVEHILEHTAPGQKIIDIGRMLSEVEVRTPDGTRLDFVSIGFTDVYELRTLLREMHVDGDELPEDVPSDGPRYLVSFTLRKRPRKARQLRLPAFLGRQSHGDN